MNNLITQLRTLALHCSLFFFSIAGGQITAQDRVPESGLNAPSDKGRGTAPATAASASTRPATNVSQAASSTGLPIIRLTPRDVLLPGAAWKGRLDLAGEWGFKLDVPAGFDGRAGAVEAWDKVKVPGHFAWQGYPPMHGKFNVPVAYFRTFKVPETWAGLRVRLRFESADGLCRVYVNGQRVGESERVNTPSEFDITDALARGENQLVVTLETTLATYWSKRTMGGIARGVYLQAVPPVNIARLHVSSRLKAIPTTTDDAVPALMSAHIRIANDSGDAVGGLSARFTLSEAGSQLVPLRLRNPATPLPPIAPGTMLQMSLPIPVDAVKTWSAESPNLYVLRMELLDAKSQVVMTASQRFGFRELDTRGGELLLNGRPIKFRGANYHMTYPGIGYFLPPERVRSDVDLFHNMNLNVLRSRPVPMIEYLDHCDEIGMYTTVEGMFTLMMYDKGPQKDNGADPSVGPALLEHLAAMLESTRSNPSIVLYGLGNENPYYDYFREAAAAMQSEDVGVPLFFGSDDRNGVDGDYLDVNDDHYPRDGRWSIDRLHQIDGKGWDYPTNRPNIFSEWCHIAAVNIKEYKFDPGTDDFWGYVADLHANWTYDNAHVVGGFLFLGAPEVKIGATFPWRGFFDEYRRPYAMAWHVKKADSPIRIEDTSLLPAADDASAARLTVINRYDFRNLNSLETRWRQGNRFGSVRLEVPPRSTRQVTLPVDPAGGPVELKFVDLQEHVVDNYRLTRPDHRPQRESIATTRPSSKPIVRRSDGAIAVTVGDAVYGFDADGLMVTGDLAGTQVLLGRPEVVARPMQFKNFQGLQKRTLVNQCVGWKAAKVTVNEFDGGVTIIAEGAYTLASGTIATSVFADGRCKVAYNLIWNDAAEFPCFDWGYALRVAPEATELRWTRDAQWSVYPAGFAGRSQGIEIASGDPKYAGARSVYKEGLKPWPWDQDVLDGVTNAFRGTKFRLIRGSLSRPGGTGLTITGRVTDRFADAQHLRATPVGGDLGGEIGTRETFPNDTSGFWLEVMEYHGGSSEPHLTKSLRHAPLTITKGTTFTGSVQFSLTARPIEVDETVNSSEAMP